MGTVEASSQLAYSCVMKNGAAGKTTFSQRKRSHIHAYRLVYPDRPHAPEMLWEWEGPYSDRLLWNVKTFGRTVVQRYFADWDALAEENQHIWEAYYLLRPLYEPWDTWRVWMT